MEINDDIFNEKEIIIKKEKLVKYRKKRKVFRYFLILKLYKYKN